MWICGKEINIPFAKVLYQQLFTIIHNEFTDGVSIQAGIKGFYQQ